MYYIINRANGESVQTMHRDGYIITQQFQTRALAKKVARRMEKWRGDKHGVYKSYHHGPDRAIALIILRAFGTLAEVVAVFGFAAAIVVWSIIGVTPW